MNRPPEPPLAALSFGIASDPDERSACICALDHRRGVLTTRVISSSGLSLRLAALEAGRCDVIDQVNLDTIAGFVATLDPAAAPVAVLAQTRRMLPPHDVSDTPAGIFAWTDVALGSLVALGRLGLGITFAVYEVPEQESIVVHHVVDSQNPTGAPQPRMLAGDLLRACARLILDVEPNIAQAAAIAALLARAPGAYYYWSTFDAPPSLMDVTEYRRRGQTQMWVMGSTETFSMRVRASGTVEDVALAYALALQKYGGLDPSHKHKIALLEICKEFGYDMRCYSRRMDAPNVDPRRVWPWPAEDAWAVEAIGRL